MKSTVSVVTYLIFEFLMTACYIYTYDDVMIVDNCRVPR